MSSPPRSWLARRVESALREGFVRAYETLRVDPDRYLFHLRTAHELPIATFRGMATLPIETVDDVAEQTIRAGMKLAAAEGAGMGLGGLVTLVPDLSILAIITFRTLQKLSLIYGFEFNTDEEVAELWMAAASAAGVDISREVIEKEVVNRFVPRVIRAIAAQASKEIVEKWAGRLVPLVSSAIGAGLNYYFVRAWGERAQRHFREKHLELRQRLALETSQTPALPGM
jgi:EcsC protein family